MDTSQIDKEYFHGVTKYKIIGLVVLFTVLMLVIGTVSEAQDNRSNEQVQTSPTVQTPYVPAKPDIKPGHAGEKTYWPYPSWQIASWVNRCIQTFPTLVPEIQQQLWPKEMWPFCSCVMDRFRGEWAYRDFIANFHQGAKVNNPSLNALVGDYGRDCIANVVRERMRAGYFPDPDGTIPLSPGMPGGEPKVPDPT